MFTGEYDAWVKKKAELQAVKIRTLDLLSCGLVLFIELASIFSKPEDEVRAKVPACLQKATQNL